MRVMKTDDIRENRLFERKTYRGDVFSLPLLMLFFPFVTNRIIYTHIHKCDAEIKIKILDIVYEKSMVI